MFILYAAVKLVTALCNCKEIKKFLNYDNLTRYETFEGEHPIDPSGKSFVIQTFFETQAREIIELQCADFDSSVQKNGDNEA